jgi:predicted nucleic acid-binding protein
LPEETRSLALDASVLINFLGSGIPDRLIQAFAGRILVAEPVYKEVYNDPGHRVRPREWMESLDQGGLLEIVRLSGEALQRYLDFGAAGLDNGEAATLALALDRNAIPVIDEKRARRLYAANYPGARLSSTVELFHELSERDAVAEDILRAGLFDAIRIARMRVLPEMMDWVIAAIGPENAESCSSIPAIARNSRPKR